MDERGGRELAPEENLSQERPERERYIDALRAVAVTLVILLHCVGNTLMNAGMLGGKTWWFCNLANAVSRTGVPLFFMISGHLLLGNPKSEDVLKFYKRRFSRLLLPFAVWSLIYYADAVLQKTQELSFSAFFGSLINSGTAYHLWFVYSIAAMYLLTPFIARAIRGLTRRELIVFLLICTFASTLRPFLNLSLGVYINLFDPLVNGYLGYMVLGYILGSCRPSRPARAIIYIAGVLGFCYAALSIYMKSSPEGIVATVNGGYMLQWFLVAGAIFTLFKTLGDRLPKRTAKHAKRRGGYDLTYGVYFIHVLVLNRLLLAIGDMRPIAGIALSFAGTVIISFAAVYLLSKNALTRRIFM
jgi:surface polysaccharide O-acyltransferase-like enzyme